MEPVIVGRCQNRTLYVLIVNEPSVRADDDPFLLGSIPSVVIVMLLLFLLVDMEDEDGTCLLDVLW